MSISVIGTSAHAVSRAPLPSHCVQVHFWLEKKSECDNFLCCVNEHSQNVQNVHDQKFTHAEIILDQKRMNSNEDDSANPSDSGEDLKSKSGDNDLHCPGDSGDGSDMDDVNAGALTERENEEEERADISRLGTKATAGAVEASMTNPRLGMTKSIVSVIRRRNADTKRQFNFLTWNNNSKMHALLSFCCASHRPVLIIEMSIFVLVIVFINSPLKVGLTQ